MTKLSSFSSSQIFQNGSNVEKYSSMLTPPSVIEPNATSVRIIPPEDNLAP